MERENPTPEDSLLDLHLDRLDAEARARLERELELDAGLRAKSDQLGRILQPLDAWTVGAEPQNLADRVLANLDKRVPSAASSKTEPPARGGGRVWPFRSLRDVIAVAACIGLLFGVVMPGISMMRDRSQRALCGNHLASIFRGTVTYQEMSAGSLPFAGRVTKASWLPGGSPDTPFASNGRHLYLLLKSYCGTKPDDFICPGGKKVEGMPVDRLASFDDFQRAGQFSYASLNMGGSAPNVRPTSRIAFVGDTNPLFANARFDPSIDPDRTNSPAHGGRGQTVLTLDGNTQWLTKPFYGPRHDNLWLAGNIRHYTGTEAPTSHEDAQLVPGYPADNR